MVFKNNMGILDTVNARYKAKKHTQVIANVSPLEAIAQVITKFMAVGVWRDTVQINHSLADDWGDKQRIGDTVTFRGDENSQSVKVGRIVSLTNNAAYIQMDNRAMADRIAFSNILYNHRLNLNKY